MSDEATPSAGATRPGRLKLLRPRRLIGRDSELREIGAHIALSPVTTLTGPGGVGKTALAIAVAAARSSDFPDGVTVAWLGSVRSPELVAAEVAAQLELPQSGGHSYEDALIRWLADRDVLLVIDNCEHVLSAVADLVDALTARLPRLRVLATSREPLWIDGEATFRLAPLSAEPAVQLFRERAGARALAAFAAHDTEHAQRTFAEICRRVDGLPLAIELAAARVAGLEPDDIASHLDDLFTLLPQPVRRADGARRSLRATVEWSDALLGEPERRLLRRMGVFAGRFDLVGIKRVCAEEGQTAAQVADLTARLVEKSLLLKLDGSGGYHLLETIRQYCVAQLVAASEIDAVRERHARFYLGVALDACAGLTAGPERLHLDIIESIEDNLRVALECLLRIEPASALSLGAGLTQFWWIRGRLREGIGWVEQALARATDAPPDLRAAAWFGHAFLVAHDTDDWSAAASSIDVGLDVLANASEPPPIVGMLMCLRGECDVFAGDAKSGVRRTEAGLEIVRRHAKGSWADGFSLWNVANAKRADGDAVAATALFVECADLCSRLGCRVGEMVACNSLGELAEERGELVEARTFWERALRCREEIGAVNVGYVHGSMPLNMLAIARVAAKQGERATASKVLRDALPIAQEIRDTETARRISELLTQTLSLEPTQSATLRPEGGVWHVSWSDKSVHVPDMKGLWHLRELVARPREPVLALTLIAAKAEDAVPFPVGDAGPMLDREALRQFRKRLADLDEELDDAEARHDVEGHRKRSAEREALLKEVARATGLGGKPRRTGSPTEKARLNVTRTIRHAISHLATALPELAAHLDEAITTGVSCCYEPRSNIAWTT